MCDASHFEGKRCTNVTFASCHVEGKRYLMTVPFASHQLEGRRSSTVIGILNIWREAVLACVLHSSSGGGEAVYYYDSRSSSTGGRQLELEWKGCLGASAWVECAARLQRALLIG